MKKILISLSLLLIATSARAMEEETFTKEQLFSAINTSDIGLAMDIIGSGHIDLASTDEKGDTALHRAAWHLVGIPQMGVIIDRLLLEGADPQAENDRGITPLDKAIANLNLFRRPGEKSKPETYSVKWLRFRLADPKAKVLKDAEGAIYRNPDKAIIFVKSS